jgi:S1-C subfamily serine protease
MRRFLSFGPAFVVLVTAIVTLAVVPGAIRRVNDANTQAQVRLARQAIDGDDVLERMNAAVRNIAVAVEPSVVHLEVVNSIGLRRPVRSATGSGWVYDEQGHIITNAHVVSGSSGVLVQFYDGRIADAEVIGADPASDIAVLRVDPGSHLVPARRGSGQRVERGDRVFAFGSPFGFKFSMSEGIVSGLGRSARTMSGYNGISNFIQTDAAVNPGNSGGPLVDIRGRVVGMNVAIATAQEARGGIAEGQSAGISFAIPLETIETRVDQIVEGGPIRTGFLGITFSTAPISGIRGFDGRGVAIEAIQPGGAADRAGLLVDDVITHIDGQTVHDGEILRSLIASRRPGEKVRLKAWRDGTERDVEVVLGEMPPETLARMYGEVLYEQFGLRLRNTADGPIIDSVEEGSAAAASGLEAGEIIRNVAGSVVGDAEDVVKLLFEGGLFGGRRVKMNVSRVDGDTADKPREITLKMMLPGR